MKLPDNKKAHSILEAATRDMQYTQTLTVTPQAAPTILRNIYECFRMLGEAILTNKGIRSNDHIQPIDELLTLNIKTTRPIRAIENLRNTRHNINYRGYQPSIAEVKDALDFANTCFTPAAKVVQKHLKNSRTQKR